MGARGGRLVSVCSGVFVLAAAGLLNGRRAATHRRYAELLAHRYPDIRADPDVLHVDEGDVLTSAGSAAGLDLCLRIVRRDHGGAVANNVARRLLLAPTAGGQRQFVDAPIASTASGGRLAALFDWLPDHLDKDLTIADLARQAGMSLRAFQRHFRGTFGTTPGEWLIRQRVARARELVETTGLTVGQVADTAGFGSVETLRLHFRRVVDTPPDDTAETSPRQVLGPRRGRALIPSRQFATGMLR